MTIRYIYQDRRGSRQLIGCVCRTDDGRLSYSLCHPLDRRKLTKKRVREIALARAEKRTIFYDDFNELWFSARNGHARMGLPHTVLPYLNDLLVKQEA